MMNKRPHTQKIFFYTISAIIGLAFLFSAYAKTQPVSFFVNMVYDRFNLNYHAATLLAKGLIGLEAGLGILFIIGLYGKWRWVLQVSLSLVLAFTAYIIGLWIKDGQDADCGCFGEMIKLDLSWSLIKNLVLLALILLLIWKDRKQESRSRHYLAWIITFIFICYPFIFYPNQLDIESMYTAPGNHGKELPVDLRQGKHIVAFMSLGCSHCRDAAKIFANMKKEDPDLPLIFIFGKRPEQQQELLTEFELDTGSGNIPKHFTDKEVFMKLAGNGVPSIYLLKGAEVEDKIDNFKKMKLSDLKKWYNR